MNNEQLIEFINKIKSDNLIEIDIIKVNIDGSDQIKKQNELMIEKINNKVLLDEEKINSFIKSNKAIDEIISILSK